MPVILIDGKVFDVRELSIYEALKRISELFGFSRNIYMCTHMLEYMKRYLLTIKCCQSCPPKTSVELRVLQITK